tara:strand:- start:2541 stop:3434 length:894 start_codon:yes stop_codon:yes gene_type:complete
METQIAPDAVDPFVEHLDKIGPTEKISLILYTVGGDTSAAWNIINLLHIFADDLEVIVPRKALSSGTIMSLGADRIIMTKQATLGPIDPSINGPMNPQIPGAGPHARTPVSVEAIQGYLNIATEDLKIDDAGARAEILMHLANNIHPLVLGQIFRSRSQIRELANQLLPRQVKDEKKREKIVSFLCSDSGSHDYTMNRREARKLGLNIETPSPELYGIINKIYGSFVSELELRTKYDPVSILGNNASIDYAVKRCLIESVQTKPDRFVSEGILRRLPANHAQPNAIHDQRNFEGWKK